MFITKELSDPRVIQTLHDNGVGVIPTDTVYGVVCRAADETAVTRLYALKKREAKPGTIIAAQSEDLVRLGIKSRYLKPVLHYWPNPISVVIPTHDLRYLHQGVGSIAVRIPKDQTVRDLLSQTGPLLTSSANQPGEKEAASIDEAQAYFGETVDFYVDGGEKFEHKASTIIRVVDDVVEVLRHGAVQISESGEVIDRDV